MDRRIFLASLYFVLGFASVFSLLGILLQTVLSKVSYEVMLWLGRIGGILIILFGLFILFQPDMKELKFKVKKSGLFITSFLFGAAFAAGWTPCVGPALGAILALATTNPSSAFILMFSYTLGLGLPFLLVGLFMDKAESLIKNMGKSLRYIQYAFGIILIIIGLLIFAGRLSSLANSPALVSAFAALNIGFSTGITGISIIAIIIAFLAGLVSFLSPCVLPILPGFLSYLSSTALTASMEAHEK